MVREVKQKQILPDKQGTLQPKSKELELPSKAPITNDTSVIKDKRMRVDKLEQDNRSRPIVRESQRRVQRHRLPQLHTGLDVRRDCRATVSSARTGPSGECQRKGNVS